jgi:riboflavin kinase/FMN adenylyltransferase
MLGRPYAISGRVVEGDKIGRKLGFPTANLDAANLILPSNGVYSGCTIFAGKLYRVALNIGLRPTVASAKPQLRVEAHLLDFDGRLYGEDLEIEIGEKLRNEQKFVSAVELREQIARDIAQVRAQV